MIGKRLLAVLLEVVILCLWTVAQASTVLIMQVEPVVVKLMPQRVQAQDGLYINLLSELTQDVCHLDKELCRNLQGITGVFAHVNCTKMPPRKRF